MKKINLVQLKETINIGKTFVMFSAEWCGECKMNFPMVEIVEKNTPEIKFVKIDVDQNELWDEDKNENFQIKSVPTFIIYQNGEKIIEHIGFSSLEKIEEIVKT